MKFTEETSPCRTIKNDKHVILLKRNDDLSDDYHVSSMLFKKGSNSSFMASSLRGIFFIRSRVFSTDCCSSHCFSMRSASSTRSLCSTEPLFILYSSFQHRRYFSFFRSPLDSSSKIFRRASLHPCRAEPVEM